MLVLNGRSDGTPAGIAFAAAPAPGAAAVTPEDVVLEEGIGPREWGGRNGGWGAGTDVANAAPTARAPPPPPTALPLPDAASLPRSGPVGSLSAMDALAEARRAAHGPPARAAEAQPPCGECCLPILAGEGRTAALGRGKRQHSHPAHFAALAPPGATNPPPALRHPTTRRRLHRHAPRRQHLPTTVGLGHLWAGVDEGVLRQEVG